MSPDGALDQEIVARISKASQTIGRLRSRVLSNRNIKLLKNNECVQVCGANKSPTWV